MLLKQLNQINGVELEVEQPRQQENLTQVENKVQEDKIENKVPEDLSAYIPIDLSALNDIQDEKVNEDNQMVIEEKQETNIHHQEQERNANPNTMVIEGSVNPIQNIQFDPEKSETLKDQKAFVEQFQKKLSLVSGLIKNSVIDDVPMDILIQLCVADIVEEQTNLVKQ